MKSESEIRNRLNQLLADELNRRIALASERLPERCTHNHRQSLDSRKQVEGETNEAYNRTTRGPSLPVLQTIGLCMLGSEDPTTWPGTICEEPVDAKRCPTFQARQGKTELLQEFRGQLRDATWLKEHGTEIHLLLWLLGEAPEASPEVVKVETQIETELQPEPLPEKALPLPPVVIPVEPEPDDPAPPLSWWKRWILKMLFGTKSPPLLP